MAINIKKIKEEYKEKHEQGDFETMPKGSYDCFVYDLEGGMSQNDNPKIDITLKVARGDFENRRLWTNITLTPAAWWKAEEFFKAVDYDIDQLPEEAETPEEIVAFIRDDIIGEKITAVVNHRKWEGETRENVKRVTSPSESFESEELEDAEDVPF